MGNCDVEILSPPFPATEHRDCSFPGIGLHGEDLGLQVYGQIRNMAWGQVMKFKWPLPDAEDSGKLVCVCSTEHDILRDPNP